MPMFGVYTDSALSFSLLGNLLLGVGLWVSGLGRRVLLRIRQQWQYKKGGYVNTVFVSKNGTAEEIFKKIDVHDKSLKIGSHKYVIDRKKTILFDGIPTMLHFEGLSEPQSWTDPLSMSTGELQQIIENNKREGFMEMLAKYYPVAILLVVVCILFSGLALYFNWQIFDSIVQDGARVIGVR